MSLYRPYKWIKNPETGAKIRKEFTSPFWYYEFEVDGERYRGPTEKTNKRDARAVELQEKTKKEEEIRKLKEAGGAKGTPKTLGSAMDAWWDEVGQHLPNQTFAFAVKKYMARILNWEENGVFPLGKDTLLTEIDDKVIVRLINWRRSQMRVTGAARQGISPAEVKRVWESMEKPSAHAVVKVLKANGHRITRHTVSRWHQADWADLDYGPVANSTVNRTAVQPMQRIFVRATEVWKMHLPNAPDWSERMLPENNERPRPMRRNENEAIKKVMDPDYEEVRMFSAVSGLRREEVLLKWSQVNWDGRPRSTIGKNEHPTIRLVAKGNKTREIQITNPMAEILFRQWGKHKQAVFTYCAQHSSRGNGYKPPRVKGDRYPITVSGLVAHWERRRAKAAEEVSSIIDPTRRHSLTLHRQGRHTYATNVARNCKGNARAAQKLLGHADIKTTMRYIDATDDEMREISEAAGSASLFPDQAENGQGTDMGSDMGELRSIVGG